MKLITIAFLSLTLLGATGTWLASTSATPDSAAAPESLERTALPVQTMRLQPVYSIDRDRQFTGTVQAARRTSLAFERPARLIRVLCDEGQKVVEGQVLATIDHRQLLARVNELEAGIRQQDAVLKELINGPRSEVIAAAKSELAAISTDVELKRATYDRAKGLFDRRATSEQTLDEVRLAWKAGVAKQDAIARKLDELTAGTRQEQIDAQTAVLDGLQSRLSQLKIDIADSQLHAPFAGTIVKRYADEGGMLNPQQPVVELLETSQLEARIGVPSEFINSLDRTNYVVMKAGQNEFTGHIRDVIAEVDPSTRTQTVIIQIDNADDSGLADGSLIRLAFTETKPIEGFRVPLTALASGSRGLWSAYVLESADDDSSQPTIAARTVEVIHTDGDTAVVRGTIYEGDRIVTDGVHRIVPGQLVTDMSSERTKD